jgi:hypothetical protein
LRGDEVAEPKGDTDFADARRAATNGGWARGDARFKRQIVKALDRQGSNRLADEAKERAPLSPARPSLRR